MSNLCSINQSAPVNFQIALDERNNTQRQQMIAHQKDAVSQNMSSVKIKSLEDRNRVLENMLIEKEALHADSFNVKQQQQIQMLQKKIKQQSIQQALNEQVDLKHKK